MNLNEIFKDVDLPVFGPDERQTMFTGVANAIRKNEDYDNVDVINTYAGWPASRVDLGWMKDKIKELIMRGVIERKKDIREFLRYSIHRLKMVDVELRERPKFNYRIYAISIKTKDDYGWYTYEFSIKIEDGDVHRIKYKGL